MNILSNMYIHIVDSGIYVYIYLSIYISIYIYIEEGRAQISESRIYALMSSVTVEL
jgi:hypothetical protein